MSVVERHHSHLMLYNVIAAIIIYLYKRTLTTKYSYTHTQMVSLP